MRIAIAIGDPHGIGPEIAVRAATLLAAFPQAALTLVGDRHAIEHAARACFDLEPAMRDHALARVHDVAALPRSAFACGQPSAEGGAAAVAYATEAIRLTAAGRFDAVVAAPHSETAIAKAGIAFSGYPSLLARVLGIADSAVFLLLVGGGLRIAHATLHERLQSALARLDAGLVVAAARTAVRATQRLGIGVPRLGVFGINPHAGEGGLFGDDDERVTVPAVRTLREDGIDVEGPLGADLLLSRRAHDVYLAMYHDQGHIPIKLLCPNRAAAVSIGGDVLLASVAHGCAFDIAGKGLASPDALVETIRLVTGSQLR